MFFLAPLACSAALLSDPSGSLPRANKVTTTTKAWPSTFELPAALDLTAVSEAHQKFVADLFVWEHGRAAQFERIGNHPYWADPRIHNFGNQGWRGFLHALVVPIATAAIDEFAYNGFDARKALHESEFPKDADVVDLCCGVGFSPARNGRVTAVDASHQMAAIARLRRPDIKKVEVGNAETWGEVRAHTSFSHAHHIPPSHLNSLSHVLPSLPSPRLQTGCTDIATVMFGMHEMPQDGRRRVLRNALRIAKSKVMVVDIWPGFEPSPMMLSGEPFILEYLENIEGDVDAVADPSVWEVTRVDVVEQHVRMWKFERLDWGI